MVLVLGWGWVSGEREDGVCVFRARGKERRESVYVRLAVFLGPRVLAIKGGWFS